MTNKINLRLSARKSIKMNYGCKKGASHVGVILSFVIFITFLTFMFSIIEPNLRINRDKEALLEYMKLEVREEIKSNLSYQLIEIPETFSMQCLSLERDLNKLEQNSLVKEIRTGEGEISIGSYQDGDSINIFDYYSQTSLLIKVYYSQEPFTSYVGECKEIYPLDSEKEYSIVNQKEAKEIFLSKINELMQEYSENYDLLKQRLNVPAGSDFSVVFEDKDGKSTEASIEKSSDNIYSDKTPIQYVDEQANLNPGFLTISVW